MYMEITVRLHWRSTLSPLAFCCYLQDTMKAAVCLLVTLVSTLVSGYIFDRNNDNNAANVLNPKRSFGLTVNSGDNDNTSGGDGPTPIDGTGNDDGGDGLIAIESIGNDGNNNGDEDDDTIIGGGTIGDGSISGPESDDSINGGELDDTIIGGTGGDDNN